MPIRWGIIGCGDVARRRVAAAISSDAQSECLAACRRDPVRLAQFCADFEIPRAYATYQELLADGQIDAVYVATPVSAHCAQVVAAAAAGKHVLVEKPMGCTVAECDHMIDACQRAGVRLGVAYYRRFYPIVERMYQLLQEGSLGELLSISAVTANPFQMSPGDEGYWRVLPDVGGGGSLMDIGSHRLNLFRHLGGPLREVKAYCDTIAAPYAAENVASLILRFQSGAHGMLQCFFGSPFDPDSFTITGTRGQISSAPLNGGQLVCELDGQRHVESHPPAENLNAPLIADFASAIQAQRPPEVAGEEGRETNAFLANAYLRSQLTN
ncbi:MAG: dehydrogenase [Planctomycetaceae bacterium]|nr:dehydrogenase [Planctomycetaceae bacterium]